MKKHILLTSIVLGSLLSITGCSSSSDDSSNNDGGGAPATTTSEVSASSMNNFARSASNQLGCIYTERTSSAASSSSLNAGIAIFPIRDMVKSIIAVVSENDADEKRHLKAPLRRAPQTTTEVGPCGGEMSTTLDDVTMRSTFSYNNYCSTTEDSVQSIIDGELSMQTVTATDGSATMTVSTSNDFHIRSTNPNTDERIDTTLQLTGLSIYSSTGEFNLDMENPTGVMHIRMDSITVNDAVTGTRYSFQDVVMDINGENITYSSQYVDPILGVVTLSIVSNGTQQTGNITITGANGETAHIYNSETEGILNVESDGSNIGVMDCSMIDTGTN